MNIHPPPPINVLATALEIFSSLPCVHHQTIRQNARIPVFEKVEIEKLSVNIYNIAFENSER